MGEIERAIFDTGPLIHLAEINKLDLLDIAEEKLIPKEVENEFKDHRIEELDIDVHKLNNKGKKYAELLVKEHYIDLGEAEAISLSKQEGIAYLFTDDWYAREVAQELTLKVHGSVGIVMRAYREGILEKKPALNTIDDLYNDSSLFITSKIVSKGKIHIEKYQKR